MKSVRFWEQVNAIIWPAFESILFDGWLLRFTPGYSRNSNTVWPLYDGELPLRHKISFCEQLYFARGLSCGFRLSEIPSHALIEEALVKEGYARDNPNLVMIRSSVDTPKGNITELSIDEWLETAYNIHPVDDPHMKDWERQFLMKISLTGRFAVVRQQGKACGYGRSVLLGDILNIEDLWVQPDQRGQGLGSQLIQGLLQKGRDDGATIAYLTVNLSNTGAQRLYTRLGFENRYTYQYLVPEIEVD